MALLDEIDPPSLQHREAEQTKNLKKTSQNKYYLKYFKDKLFNNLFKLRAGRILNNFFVPVKDFFLSTKYAPHTVIIFIALAVSITNLSQKMAAKAYFEEIVTITPDIEYSVTQNVEPYTPLIKNSPEMVQKLLTANLNSGGFLLAGSSVATQVTDREEPSVLPSNASQTVTYIVAEGDTLSGLGMKFDLKLATLKYVNNISDEDRIRPGTKLKIPPKGYEISSALIAKREKENAKLALANRNTVTRSSTKRSNVAPGSRSNGYPYGWCTYYVATQRYVPPSWGNAKEWLGSARRSGYSTGSEPAVGAIVVTSESGWGHLAYVESVSGGKIIVSEMNYEGWGVVSRRTISAYGGVVRGYVY